MAENPESTRLVTARLRDATFAGHWAKFSPNRLLLVLAASVFFAEIGAMLLMETFPPLTKWTVILLDSTILLVILSPVYLLIYRPFWRARQQADESIRRLTRRMIRAEEETRKALARDLHDEFGQTLSALQFGIDAVKNSLPDDQEPLVAHCERLSQMTAQLGKHVRDVTARLRPGMLDDFGLVPTLREHLEQFRALHPHIALIIKLPDETPALSAAASLALYRVCQESLHNIVKHARATRVTVALSQNGKMVDLLVEDDGRGGAVGSLDAASGQSQGGVGILGMRERMADVGGTLQLRTRPKGGTRIWAAVPVASEGEA